MKKHKLAFLLVLAIAGTHLSMAQEAIPKKVLFVGNSYTYFWNLPQNVALMAESRDIEMTTRQSTAGGANLGQHWNYQKKLKSRDIIEAGDFDAIILQDHSMRATDHPDSLLYFGEKFGDLVKSKNAKAYVYMTWAREWNPYMQQPIMDKYTELAERIDAEIVPVGLAWQRCRKLRPELKLYDPDGSHPSTVGTYLSACVFFGILTDQSPVGLPHRLISEDKYGEKLYVNIQSEKDALFLQQVAAEVCGFYD